MRHRLRADHGNAVLEFVMITVAVFMPLTYIVISLAQVQSANMAAAQAAREATRAFMMGDSPAEAASLAESAARLAMANHRLALTPGALRLDCHGQCLAPGSAVSATVDWRLALPWVPASLRAPASVPITVTHTAPIDTYRGSVAQ